MDGINLRTKVKIQEVSHLPWKLTKNVSEDNPEADTRYDHILRCQNYRGIDLYLNTHTEILKVKGSIQTFTKGTNYEGFAYSEFVEGVGTLADVLNCKPVDLAVINSEISSTIRHSPIYTRLRSFGNKPFHAMTKKGTGTVYGTHCLLDQYGFKVYSKTDEQYLRHRKRITPGLLQAEFLVRDKGYYKGKPFNLPNPTLQDLLLPKVFKTSFDHMIAKVNDIQLATSNVNWEYVERKHGISPSERMKIGYMHNPEWAADLKRTHPETYKKCKKVYDRVKADLSEGSTAEMEVFKQSLRTEVESKYDW